jgi:hypothetical protein
MSNLNELKIFKCNNNKIVKIVFLPPFLKQFYCCNNQISKIENLPFSLELFQCSGNKIKKIENLPCSLKKFYCHNNPIKKMKNLPFNLIELYCPSQVKLINLPTSLKIFNNIYVIKNSPNDKITLLKFEELPSLKYICRDFILTNLNVDLSSLKNTVPDDLISYLSESKFQQCYNCRKYKYIFLKKTVYHQDLNCSCKYLFCTNCWRTLKKI